MSSPEHKRKIWNLIKDIKVGMLTTMDGEDMRGRPMHIVQSDYDNTLWFFTRRSAAKVYEADHSKSICLTFSDPDNGVYVSLSGHARLSDDRGLIDRFWNPFVAAWFDEGRADPEVALLEVGIYRGEHWEAQDNRLFQLFEVTKVRLTDQAPNLGENEKFAHEKPVQ